MAGPFDDGSHRPRDFFLRHDDNSAAYHHHASDDEGFNQPDDAERTPFYRYYDEQHGSGRAHNASEASLPMYRSRSQSQSLSMANGRHNTVVSDDKEEQQQQHEQDNGTVAPPPPHAHHATFAQGQPPMPSIRAVDYQQHSSLQSALKSSAGTTNSASATAADTTGWSSNANTLTNSTGNNNNYSSHQEDGQHQRHQAGHPHKRIDWAADVAKVFDQVTKASRTLPDEKAAASQTTEKPTLSRASTEQDMDDENAFDDYDWEDDDELVKQLDEKYEEEYKKAHPKEDHRRRTVIRRFSPFHLGKLILTTFLGNLLLILALVAASLIVQFLVKNKTDDSHLQFVCDNIEAWCYWVAFNFIAQWAIHGLFVIIPKLFVFVIQLIWGELDEIFIGYVEMFNANAPYVKPLFFAGFFWGSFAIIFNSIFHLRDASNPNAGSRAHYTFRLYQVVELLFFIALVYSLEKILVRIISLNFHAVAYSDRLSNNAFALSTIDKLKSYRPKKRKSYYPKSGANTPSGMHRFGPDGYFSSPYTRSRANTPPFGNNSNNAAGHNSPASMTNGSPRTPGAPQPSHHSLWSRLPIPNAFRGHPQEPQLHDNAIPMQVTNAHGGGVNESYNTAAPGRDRTATQSTANSNHSQHQYGGNDNGNAIASAEASAPGTPFVPHTPAVAEEGSGSNKKHKKGRKAFRLFGRGSATAQQIARQAMVDPLATLNNPDVVGRGLGLDFGSAADAKKLARDLFHAFRGDQSRNYLITKDFYPAFKSEQEAEAAFAVFDKDGNGDISRPEIRATILAAYKERRFLARSLQDVSEAVSTLDRLFQVAAWIIIAMIAFSIFKVNIYSNLTTAYTIALAVSFIFKSAAQNVFDSVIFLFATHPFDSGDRIFLEGETYVVKRLGLFSTLFTKWDGTETMIANSKLGTLTITNLRRSPPQFENATLQFGWNTTLEQIDELEAKLNNWLQKDEKRMFAPSTAAVIGSFNYMRWIEVNIGMLHRANWQDWGERWNNRTAFHAAILHYSKEVGIAFVNSAQPVEYWQEDLDKPIEEEQDDDLDDLRSPLSPAEGSTQIPAPANLQPVMGFVPAEGSTMKRRKGYSKKVGLSGAGT